MSIYRHNNLYHLNFHPSIHACIHLPTRPPIRPSIYPFHYWALVATTPLLYMYTFALFSGLTAVLIFTDQHFKKFEIAKKQIVLSKNLQKGALFFCWPLQKITIRDIVLFFPPLLFIQVLLCSIKLNFSSSVPTIHNSFCSVCFWTKIFFTSDFRFFT